MKKKTIVLTGMPGVGKTTLGKMLAQKLKCKFIDTDDLIIETDGRNIPEIFSESGEKYFRDLETRVLNNLFSDEKGKMSEDTMHVIALGGGTVLREENYEIVKGRDYLKKDFSESDIFIEKEGKNLVPGKNVIKQNENIVVVFIQRSIEELLGVSVSNRPVSQSTPLEELYQKRLPFYKRWADIEICIDNMTPEDSASCILERLMLS